MKILDKKYPEAYLWKTSINNHLWWSSKTCKGDGLLLTQKFTSVLKHISNIHEWEEDGIIQKCEHETLSEEYKNNTLWIHPDSESYNALKKILLAKDFLKDLQHAKHFVHTGRLESYHNSEFTFLKKCEEIGKVFCTVCKAVFSIEHGGRSDIKQHMEKKKHTSALSNASKSDKVTSYFIKQGSAGLTSEGLKIAAEEGMFAFHTIVHNHSFRSMVCTTTLIKKLHEKKFSCARTKCESIILNVLAPFAMNQIIDELKAVNFATIIIDTSNHKNLKIVPILIRYFDPKTGVQIKVLEFTNLKGETSDILSSYIMEILTKHKLSHKIIAFTGDNCNTNFGGAARRGTKNVFTILNNNFKTNISGIGRAAHILHNAMQTSTDILPIDIECIVNKIFQYFYIYTVRVEALKEFCDFTNTQYKNVLGSVKTRWLSLQPAVSRIIEMYPVLKLYFDTQDKCPTILKSFFSDSVAIIWFHFIQSQLKVVWDTIKRIEGENISACEVAEELEILCGKIKNRKTQNFITSSVN
ncbi:hypothetical protein QTP88_022777 [Uroleucon formosanum]